MEILDSVNAVPAIAAVMCAFFTASFLSRRAALPIEAGRHASIDGLRGYLAFFVFLHHACIWYFYQRSGKWQVPPSHLYTHMGQSSVALFFMITGFLFFSKLIEGRHRSIDWLKLFVSRVLRLLPLYLVAMLLLFATVAVLSDFQLNEPASNVAKQCIRWLSFTMLDSPPINGIDATRNVLAGVTWSLPYEWFFYGTLPLLALIVGVRPRWPYLLLGSAATVWLVSWRPLVIHLWPFVGGFAAALLVRSETARRWAVSQPGSVLAIGAIVAAVARFPNAQAYEPLLLLSLAFAVIACGNTLFGLLLHPASRMLGEMAYSLYLLHGFLLFMLFHFILGADHPGFALSASAHWGWVLVLTPGLVCIGYISFRWIELPAMQATAAVTRRLRAQWNELSRSRSRGAT